MKLAKCAVILCCLLSVATAFAQGGPPLLTDDPGTVEYGKWEINVAWIHRRLVTGRIENELPHFDANRGLSNRAHFKVEIPWLFATDMGTTLSGDGNASIGVKYRFIDGHGSVPSISTYPQIGFSLASRSVHIGLADAGTNLLIPIQMQWDRGEFGINIDGGMILEDREYTGWLGGIAIGKHLEGMDVLAELHGEGVAATHESNWIAQLGLRREISERATLLFAFGKTISARNTDALAWNSYFGIQLHY